MTRRFLFKAQGRQGETPLPPAAGPSRRAAPKLIGKAIKSTSILRRWSLNRDRSLSRLAPHDKPSWPPPPPASEADLSHEWGDTRLPPRTPPPRRGSFSSPLNRRSPRRKLPFPDRLFLLPRSQLPVLLLPFLLSVPSSNFSCKLHRSAGSRGARSVFLLSPARRLKRKQLHLLFHFLFSQHSSARN